MEIVRARQQRIWKLPAVINFTLGSMGAGYYLMALVESLLEAGPALTVGIVPGVVAVVLILTGFFALVFEAGNPLKSYLSILNVRNSWMSRELMFAMLFMALLGLNALLSISILCALAGVMALMFIVSQAFIIYRSRAILAWNVWPIPPLFVFSGISSGYGLWLLLQWSGGIRSEMLWLGALLLLLSSGILLYFLFAYRRADSAFQAATRALRARSSLGLGVVAGLLGPMVWVAAAALMPQVVLAEVSIAVVGLCVIAGAWRRNRDLVMKAGYFRAIDIKL